MPMPCCENAYAGSQRPCPRCGAWICHKCGVASRGALVCRRCEHRPDPATPDVRPQDLVSWIGNATLAPKAAGAGFLGSLLGGLAWAGASAAMGFQFGGLGVLAGIGSRLAVRAALGLRTGCAWPVIAGATTLPGFLFGRWLYAVIAVRASHPGAGIGVFDRPVWAQLGGTMGKWFGVAELLWIACAIAAAMLPVGKVKFRIG